MEKKEIIRKLKEILSKHEGNTSEGAIYWDFEWVGGKQIPDGMGGYKQIGGESVSAEEAFYKEMTDFISKELDKAREEGRDEGINAVLYPKFRRNENGTLKREGWVENCKISESPRPTGEEDWKKTLTDILQQEVTQEAMAEGNKTPEQEAVDFIEQELSKAREEGCGGYIKLDKLNNKKK